MIVRWAGCKVGEVSIDWAKDFKRKHPKLVRVLGTWLVLNTSSKALSTFEKESNEVFTKRACCI